jgi:hypothetical protein
MRLPKILLIGLLLISGFSVQAEGNHAFLAWGGNAPGVSINYEHNLWKNLWGGIGFGYYKGKPFGDDMKVTSIGVPVMLNALWFEGSHKLETGAGLTYVSDAAEDSFDSLSAKGADILPVFSIGYRYMPTSGVTFRAIVSPVLTEDGLNFGMGVGVGFAF